MINIEPDHLSTVRCALCQITLTTLSSLDTPT